MIRGLLAFVAVFASFQASAVVQSYDIAMKLKSNGKEISSPTVVVTEGETAKLTQRDSDGTTFWEIVARESQNQILLSFKVGKIDKDGKHTVVSKPTILAMENEPSEMTIGETGGAEILTLSVVAKRKSF